MKKIFMRFPTAIKIILIALIYFIVAVAGLQYSYQSSNATPLWPASGFALAMLLLGGISLAPGVFIGAFAANFYFFLLNDSCTPVTAGWVSLLIGIGNTAEALAGYFLLRKPGFLFSPARFLKKVKPVIRFVITSLVMCISSSTIGATSLVLGNIIEPASFYSVWFTWWTGDVTGVILVTPFIVAWLTGGELFAKEQSPAGIAETAIVITGAVITSGVVFLGWFHPSFLFTRAFMVIPFLIWASIRLTVPFITSLLLFSAVLAFVGTLEGIGPLWGPTVNESLLTVALFICVNSIMVLVLQAAVRERREALAGLRSARDHLELMVQARTKELEEKNKELERRNKELASFNYAASHDLQEPLRKILTFSDSLFKSEISNLSENGQSLLGKIQSSSARMKKLLENLLSYLHLDSKEKAFVSVDLNEVLAGVSNDLAENIAKEDARIETSPLPTITGISFQLEQLFTNLISNALKFRKKGNSPFIQIKAEVVPGVVLKNRLPDASEHYHHLRFIDNGIGFREEYAEKVFEIFQRLHAQSEFAGTGMGLAICKKIVENHNGVIYADSVPGEGTTFHIYLPVD